MKYDEYFKMNCTEDEDDITRVLGITMEELQKFGVSFIDKKMLGAIFCKVYDSILQNLEKFEKDYSSFEINFCNRFIIGYNTTEDEDDEKCGNFMVYIRHRGCDKSNDDENKVNDDTKTTAASKFSYWVMENLQQQVELITKITGDAIKELKDLGVTIQVPDVIIVIFTKVYEALVKYLTARRTELGEFEYEINFLGCFYIGAREGEESDDIYIRPNIESKLRLKNDSVASSQYE